MDAAGAADGVELINVAAIEELFNSLGLQGPLEQLRIDIIAPHLISLLPPPFVPAPDDDGSSDSEDDHFSLTSSDSDHDDDDAAAGALGPAAQDDDGQDHIGRLADDLLSNIISRLPTKEAARTMALSTRWRLVWAATPLLVDDAHLRLQAAERVRRFNAVRAVSRCVAAHPGPVRAARITRVSFHQQEYALQQLVASLAAKNVQDLVLFNRRWPLDMPLPDDILSCASLSRLYVGVWRWPFPDAAAHRPAFPSLHELGLFHTTIEDKEVDALLMHCPKLKILSFAMAYNYPSRLRVKSRSLRAVMEWRCSFDEVVIEDAPCLERLLLDSIAGRPITIVHAPRLEVLGFLDLKLHTLEIGGIVIRAGMNVRACTMLPNLKILAVKVRFWNDMEAKMLPTLLRCSPRLETLHIKSIRSKSPDNIPDDMDFWKSLASCDCLESHLKVFVFHGYQSRSQEALFIGYIFKNAKILKTHGFKCSNDVAVAGSDGSSSSDDVLVEEGTSSGTIRVRNAPSGGSTSSDDEVEGGSLSGSIGESNSLSCGSNSSDDVAVEGRPVSDTEGNASSGGSSGRYISACPASPCWSFQNAIDLSVEDPFFVLRHDCARPVRLVDGHGDTMC